LEIDDVQGSRSLATHVSLSLLLTKKTNGTVRVDVDGPSTSIPVELTWDPNVAQLRDPLLGELKNENDLATGPTADQHN
jgi:hypothetical protein